MHDTAETAGSLSASTPWVAEEYFASRCRIRPSSSSTSWCSRMRQSNRRRRGPVVKDKTEESHRPAANEVLARFGVTEVGYDSRTPLFLIQSAALERVPPNRPSSASPLARNHGHSRTFLDFYDGSSSSSSPRGTDRPTSEGEILAKTEAETKTNEDFMHYCQQCYIEKDFDRLEPCYDWHQWREHEPCTILETRSGHVAMGLDSSSSFRYPPGNTGRLPRRPRTAPEIKMTRDDWSISGECLVIRKLKLLQKKTDDSLASCRSQDKVVDEELFRHSTSEGGDVVPSENPACEEIASWTTRNGEIGTRSSEYSTADERWRPPGSRTCSSSRRRLTSSPRDDRGSEHDAVSVDLKDPYMQPDSARLMRIAPEEIDGNLDPLDTRNVLRPNWPLGKEYEIDDGASDKERSPPFGSGLPAAAAGDDHSHASDDPLHDEHIAQLESGSRRSQETGDKADTCSGREMPRTLRPVAVAATASVQRPKTARREISSGARRHRCLRKETSEKQKMTNDSRQPLQQKIRPTPIVYKGPQRRESRRKRRSRRHHQTLISDIDSSIATAVNDSLAIDAESIIELSSYCREIPWSEEESSSAGSRQNNRAEGQRGATHRCSSSADLRSVRRRNLIDAALRRRSSVVKWSLSEGAKKVHGDPLSVPVELGGHSGEGEAIAETFQAMDSHKFDKSKQYGRIAFSQRSCRFELPMDMKQFEKLRPQEYMRKYCRISPRRQILYRKIFLKYVPMIGWFPRKDLLKFLTELLGAAVCDSDVTYICDLLQITNETRIDLELFSATAAITERLLYPQFVTQHTRHIQNYKKEEIEKADFSDLLAKLNGIRVRPEMKRLVDAIK